MSTFPLPPSEVRTEGTPEMKLDVEALAETMIDAASRQIAVLWPRLQPLAERELRLLAQSLADAADLLAAGAIDESRAHKHAFLHYLSARTVLVTLDGLSLRDGERAMDGAIRAVRETVNSVVKFALL